MTANPTWNSFFGEDPPKDHMKQHSSAETRYSGRAMDFTSGPEILAELRAEATEAVAHRESVEPLDDQVIQDAVEAGGAARAALERRARHEHRSDPAVEDSRALWEDAKQTALERVAAQDRDIALAQQRFDDTPATKELRRFGGWHSWSRVAVACCVTMLAANVYVADRTGAEFLLEHSELLSESEEAAAKIQSLSQTFVLNPALAILFFELVVPAGVAKRSCRLLFGGIGLLFAVQAPSVWAEVLGAATSSLDPFAEPTLGEDAHGVGELVRHAMLLTAFAMFGCGIIALNALQDVWVVTRVPNESYDVAKRALQLLIGGRAPWVGFIASCASHLAALSSAEDAYAETVLLAFDQRRAKLDRQEAQKQDEEEQQRRDREKQEKREAEAQANRDHRKGLEQKALASRQEAERYELEAKYYSQSA